MNKAQLSNVIADKVGVSKKQAEEMIEVVLKTITSQLQKGGEVTFTGFGTFSAKTRKARTGVNPQNPSESIEIPAVTVAKFKSGSALKAALKDSHKMQEDEE